MENNDSGEEFEKKDNKKHQIKSIRRKRIIVDIDDPESIINALSDFILDLNQSKNIIAILFNENLFFFGSLLEKNDNKINLLLSKIYYIIISKEFLYKEFIPSIKENENNKIDIILELIGNIAFLIKKMDKFLFSFELFELKKKSLGLLNCLYNNCKNKLKENNEKLNDIIELMEILPKEYYTKAFNEMSKSREIFQILQSKDINRLNQFELKICQINNYFEQFEVFKKFVEVNSDVKLQINNNKYLIEFYEKYGILLLKFCVYHNYIFLDSEEEKNNPNKKQKENENENDLINMIEKDKEENKEKIRVIFLKDKMIKYNNTNKNNINYYMSRRKKIQNLLFNKRFKSTLSTKQYYNLISKAVSIYLNEAIKGIETNPKIRPIKENLTYFLDSFKEESYLPLYLKDVTKMIINDNFSQAYLTNVFPGESNKIYLDTYFSDDLLIYIEFYLQDKSKDINFELNVYDNKTNKFKQIFKAERVDETVRFFIRSTEYSIYELIFDNTYSWFNNKNINFRISLLNPILDENSVEITDTDDYFIVNREKYYYSTINTINIYNNLNVHNIPVLINMNILTTIKIKNNDEIVFKENKEEEDSISKLFFNYVLSRYFQKYKINSKQKIFISILSMNKNLIKNNIYLQKQIDDLTNNDDIKFIENIGFVPDIEINNINVNYKLYNLNEQIVINHKLLKHKKEQEKKSKQNEEINIDNTTTKAKPLLLIHINNDLLNIIFFNKGEFHTKLILSNSIEINFPDIEIKKNEKDIYDLISKVNNNFKEIELILSYNNNIEKNQIDLIERIKIYCQQKINPTIPCYEYNTNDICKNIIKYICK